MITFASLHELPVTAQLGKYFCCSALSYHSDLPLPNPEVSLKLGTSSQWLPVAGQFDSPAKSMGDVRSHEIPQISSLLWLISVENLAGVNTAGAVVCPWTTRKDLGNWVFFRLALLRMTPQKLWDSSHWFPVAASWENLLTAVSCTCQPRSDRCSCEFLHNSALYLPIPQVNLAAMRFHIAAPCC